MCVTAVILCPAILIRIRPAGKRLTATVVMTGRWTRGNVQFAMVREDILIRIRQGG